MSPHSSLVLHSTDNHQAMRMILLLAMIFVIGLHRARGISPDIKQILKSVIQNLPTEGKSCHSVVYLKAIKIPLYIFMCFKVA